MSWLRNIFGSEKHLFDQKPSKPRGVRWVKPMNAIEKSRMTSEQLIAAETSERFLKANCEKAGWVFEDFEGPFLLPPTEYYLEYFETIREERGKGPAYKLWIFEYGNEKGHLRGMGDNEGKFHLIEHGYEG